MKNAAMPHLSVFLLGSPRVELAGAPVDINRRKAMALLAYLLATRQPHSREVLAALFWPEADQSRAFAYLRTTLWTLNAALGDEWIAAEHDTVAIRSGVDLWVDVWQFDALVAATSTGEPFESCAALSEGADLYRDDFLAGFTLPDCPAFDEWQFFQRENLRREFSRVLDDLVQCHTAAGRFQDAIPYAQRRVALDPLHEPAQRQLMRVYAWTGQWSAALRQFRQCVSILEDELGLEPEPETQALCAAIQERRSPELPGVTSPALEPVATPTPVPAGHIPVQSTPLVARERELAEIARLLDDPACRLLTLVGQGGIGKTRLALQVATEIAGRYPDGAYFVSLAPVNSARYLVPTLADALRFTPFREGDLKSQLLSYLREKHMLLVMDNFEHLLDGADLVREILSGAPKVKIFATSRERLQLQEEWLYETRGLTFPENGSAGATSVEDLDALRDYGAVQLFLHGARRVQPDFTLSEANRAAVVHICQLVEGMPLGLELAAAWLPVLSPQEIAQEIERSLDFLTVSLRDLPARHRSLRAVFESSWERLSPAEQRILCRLSIFRAAFRREAAEAVGGASLHELLALTNKSLLHRSTANRYSLHELLRQFAQEKLNADPEERDRTHRQYVAYYANVLHNQEPRLKGGQQIETLNDIEAEIANIRAAWMLAVSSRSVEAIRSLLIGLSLFNLMRSRLRESRDMLGGAVQYLETLPLTSEEQILLAEIKVMQAMAFRELGSFAEAQSLYLEALPVLRPLEHPATAIFLLMLSMLSIWPASDYEEAEDLARRARAIFEAVGDRWGVARALHALGEVAHHTVHYDQSGPLFRQSRDISREIGDHWGESISLDMLGQVAYTRGEYPEAERFYREALALNRVVGNLHQIGWCLGALSDLLCIQGRYAEAREMAFKSMTVARQTGNSYQIAIGYTGLAKIAVGERSYAEAFEFSQQGFEASRNTNWPEGPAWMQIDLCPIALDQNDADELERRARDSLPIFEKTGSPWGRSAALYYLGEAARLRGDLMAARERFVQSIRLAAGASSVMLVVRHLVGFACLLSQTGEPERAIELLALVAHHPATWQVTRDRAQRLLAELGEAVPSEIAAAARDRGRQLSVGTVVTDLLQRYRF
jgi:predicted ATPase/DNA-binding SARP family transcriptional activator